MTARPVEWVLSIFYGPSAHRATYGRLKGTEYTKDYIQLSRKAEFVQTLRNLFAGGSASNNSVPIEYVWPTGTTRGDFVFLSADRPHLKWETSLGAPRPWRMSSSPSQSSAETIPGDPTCTDPTRADDQLALIAQRGAGQPYLLAVKLKDEESKLHLRVVLENPAKPFAWADLSRSPQQIQDLVSNSTARSALAWSAFNGDGVWPSAEVANAIKVLESSTTPDKEIMNLDAGTRLELAAYLGNPAYGIFFDPDKNHDAWLESVPVPQQVRSLIPVLSAQVAQVPGIPENGDAIAEALEISAEQIAIFSGQMENGNYEVDDLYANVKTRGSAQRVFSDAVKENYDYTCAVTGIKSREFLIASHIVPWSRDKTIRLDPSNGICLSLIVDKAFESGYLLINEDLTIVLDIERMKNDRELQKHLKPYDGKTVAQPRRFPANPTYLKRRRDLLSKD